MKKPIPIIDLFAGPGGLGEGFSSLKDQSNHPVFKISLSIEKEASAHQTLNLRAFYRQFPDGKAPIEYYDYLAGNLGKYPEEHLYKIPKYANETQHSKKEALKLTLGEDNEVIESKIGQVLGKTPSDWVLIGGPPCQAYSLAGRSRNKSKKNYKPEDDKRNFLYLEYLKIIAKFQPSVFVMENVKGMLSAVVSGEKMFSRIKQDLECPSIALNSKFAKVKYRLHSISIPISESYSPNDFIIQCEKYAIPQARHRVIIIGVRNDIDTFKIPNLLLKEYPYYVHVEDVIGDLPSLRSGLSKEKDSLINWKKSIRKNSLTVIKQTCSNGFNQVAEQIQNSIHKIETSHLTRGQNWATPKANTLKIPSCPELENWFKDPSGWNATCNHETRGHISNDLQRYLFCASFGVLGKPDQLLTPKSKDFPKILEPNHLNWKSGHFADRFRVQVAKRYATTITSHISKDGHYYIHYDPTQCRSLTVREAARIQTFPDNYFFVGTRTQQYVQVGNAVPPFLAKQISEIVSQILT